MSRANRRRQKFRMKSRARKIAAEILGSLKGGSQQPRVVDQLVKNCDNLKKCSCEACRNPRRSKWAKRADKLTRQEHLADLNAREQISKAG